MNLYELGIINECKNRKYNEQLIAFILAQVKVESANYTKFRENLNYTTMDRLMDVFGKRFDKLKLSQEQINKCIKNPEYLANTVYANRMGNINADDGYKFRGAFLPQITGRDMFSQVSKIIGIDLINNLDKLDIKDVDLNVKVTLAFCDIKFAKLNLDKYDTIEEFSIIWNGGKNGLNERTEAYKYYTNKLQNT
jgi:putative chitinase